MNQVSELTTKKEYVLNKETSKIELHFSKEEYQALSNEDKKLLKRAYLFSGKLKAWVSRSKNNHYNAISTAEKLGFINGGKIGEKLSFAEELERQAEKAEHRAERMEQYSSNAENRAENLQSEFNELRKDWSWLTQPNINSSSGRSFTNQKNKVMNRYEKGFDEYRKSQYFKERAETARNTADQSNLQNRTYLNNRIEECDKNMRQLEKSIVVTEEREDNERLETLLEKMEYEIDKKAFLQNCLDDIGGVQYSKENIKAGYLVKIRRNFAEVVKANPKTVEVKFNHVPYTLKYPYAEINEMKIPQGWTDKKKVVNNPFKVGDIVTSTAIGSERIILAFQVVKTTPKSVTIQQININEDENKPLINLFKNDEQFRKSYKKDHNDNDVIDYQSWRLRRHKVS